MIRQATVRVLCLAVLSVSVACSGRPAPAAVTATPSTTPAPKVLAVVHSEPIAAPSAPPAERAAVTPGITTIAAVWQERATLAGKTITVRGKIVKYNGGILGVNWMHLQDGSGSAADGSNDLTVTSETAGRIGDVVSATGTLAVNRDIGSGYQYGAIIERARVVKP